MRTHLVTFFYVPLIGLMLSYYVPLFFIIYFLVQLFMISCSITEVKISIREYFREKAENKRNPPTTTVYTKEMRQAICREHEERFGTGYKLENVGNSKKFSKFNIIDRRPDNQAPLAEA